MCVDFCARVVSREMNEVVVESEGRRRRASTLLVPEVEVGDWVYIAVGTVIERVDPAVAEENNELLRNAQGAMS